MAATQDLSQKKATFISEAVSVADRILALARDCDELNSNFFANQFNNGGDNQLQQSDFTNANVYLTPAIITNVITAVQGITTATPQGTRDNLRQAIAGGLP